jgi:ATP-dependent helicase HrpB
LRIALLAGYPDRVARRVRRGGRQLALAGGGVAELAETSVVRDAEWLVALDAEERAHGARGGVVVRLASAIEPEWLLDLFPGDVVEKQEVSWDGSAERVVARDVMLWEGLVLHASEHTGGGGEVVSQALAEAALAAGPRAFANGDALDRWLARARFAASLDSSIPAPDDTAVRAALVALCEGHTSFAELRAAGLLDTLRASLGRHAADVDRLAPEPGIASRMQDFFGMRDGPRIGGGRVPLVLELNAPSGRAQQVTTDLAGFWQRHYPAIRKELMRKYPRHAWPEDPTAAPEATRR